MKKLSLIVLLPLLSLFSCKGYKDLSVEEFQKRLDEVEAQLAELKTAAPTPGL